MPVIAAALPSPATVNKYGVAAARYVDAVVAVGDVSRATKQAAVAVTMTMFVCAPNADVAVPPLVVVADRVWVTPGLSTLLISMLGMSIPISWLGLL